MPNEKFLYLQALEYCCKIEYLKDLKIPNISYIKMNLHPMTNLVKTVAIMLGADIFPSRSQYNLNGIFDANRQNIKKITTLFDLTNLSRSETLIKLKKVSDSLRQIQQTMTIIIFVGGHGCEINGDLRFYTPEWDTISIFEILNIAHSFDVILIHDVCRNHVTGNTYREKLGPTTKAVVACSTTSNQVSHGDYVHGGFFTFVICKFITILGESLSLNTIFGTANDCCVAYKEKFKSNAVFYTHNL